MDDSRHYARANQIVRVLSVYAVEQTIRGTSRATDKARKTVRRYLALALERGWTKDTAPSEVSLALVREAEEGARARAAARDAARKKALDERWEREAILFVRKKA